MKFPKLITRKRLKWTGLAATLLLAAAMVASYWYWPTRVWASAVSEYHWRVQVVPGGMDFVQAERNHLWVYDRSRQARMRVFQAVGMKPASVAEPFMWVPSYQPPNQQFYPERIWSVPFWMPLVLCAALATYLFRLDRKPKPGCCTKCRYDLTGLSSDTCPECGTKIATTDSNNAPASTAEGESDEAGGENGIGLEGNGVS